MASAQRSSLAREAERLLPRPERFIRDGPTKKLKRSVARHIAGYEAFLLQVLEDRVCGLLGREVAGVEHHLGVGGSLVRIRDAGELLDDPGTRLGVHALAVALLADLDRGGEVHQ